MRLVITGATGNVGSSLVERLADEDRVTEIVGVARRRPHRPAAKTTWVQADVAADDLADVVRGADAVVHLAWTFHPIRDAARTWRNNALGSIRVFEAAAAAGVGALVHASSVAAYSPAADDAPVDETWPTHALPTAGYGREKSYAERALDIVERDHPGMRVVRLRPGFIFQRASASEQRRYFAGPLVPGALARPDLIPVVPDLPGLRFQALHARDAAEAYRLALVRDVRGAFNIAAEPILDAASLADLLGARVVRMPAWVPRALLTAAWSLRLVPASQALFDLALSLPVMDTARARTELGWAPTVPALDAVREVMAGLREGSGGQTPPLDVDGSVTARLDEIRTGVGGVGGVTDDGR
ncbi:NAD-dependent epimerase/dehydratase family protein [Euzebya sp.]|uniref:NAD-dependent epimerase/dehydratase family protein n=1 Tax=Euzebya sp. TaxID=1971409 RepID=UPI003512922F